MANTYKLQSLLTLSFDTHQDLTQANVLRVYYIKPDQTNGYWTATSSTTKIVYDVQNGDIDQTGTWSLWGYYEIAGENARGATQKLKVLPNDK